VTRARQLIFNFAITCASRIFILRDRLLGRIKRDRRGDAPPAGVSRHAIHSGKNVLDAVLARPASGPAQASLLICHGIGETVQHWLGVQQLLAANGVASLVFDYSGYGRSSGFFDAIQCEQDAVRAFHYLQELTAPLPITVLGFSLGSGIAAEIIPKIPAHRLVLCAAFTSLRKAAVSIGLPKFLARGVPPIWGTEHALRTCSVPVLIVHGEEDRLFPVQMAEELNAFCGTLSELVIVPKLSHKEPFYHPDLSYWGLIISWLLRQGSDT
jgi:uncharacterized protein